MSNGFFDCTPDEQVRIVGRQARRMWGWVPTILGAGSVLIASAYVVFFRFVNLRPKSAPWAHDVESFLAIGVPILGATIGLTGVLMDRRAACAWLGLLLNSVAGASMLYLALALPDWRGSPG